MNKPIPMNKTLALLGVLCMLAFSSYGQCNPDVDPPAFDLCPRGISVGNDPGQCGAVVNYPLPTATDFCSGPPSSDLSLGDISFTGYHADNSPAEFYSFVIWPATPAGTQITFTDNGWLASGGFRGTTEGTMTWTSTSNLPEGSEVIITNGVPSTGTLVRNSSNSIALSGSGDQLFAYQGTTPTAGDMSNFIAAIQMNGSWDGDATSSTTSAKPAIFTDGVNSISISPEVDNAVYDCSTTGPDRASAQPEVLDAFNWTTNNGGFAAPGPCGFSLPSNSVSVQLVSGQASGTLFDEGTTWVSYEATDGAGNKSTCSFNIEVADLEDPSIFCPPNVTIDDGSCSAEVTYAEPTAADNCNVVPPTSSLGLGDIAFTGYSADGTDSYSFVLLKSVASGTSITFTENGWFAAGGFRSGENTHTWTASSNLPVGTEVHVAGNVPSTGSIAGNVLFFSSGGDQIFAYQGATPTAGDMSGFLAALQMNGDWDADATSSSTSAKPAIFTDGDNSNSISPEVDNAIYDCSTTTGPDVASIRAAINTSSNWITDNSNNLPCPTCGFTIPVVGGSVSPNLIGGLPSGSTFPAGVTTVTYEAVDGSGNAAYCSFDVEIVDNEDPVFANCPADITLPEDCSRRLTLVRWTPPTVSDNCTDFVDLVLTGPVITNNWGSFPVGTTTVPYTATDLVGNVGACSFNVTIVDDPNCRLGMDQKADLTVSAFPNPVTNALNVNITATSSVHLALRNAIGQELLVQTFEANGIVDRSIDMSDMAPGMYLLEIKTSTSSKIVKVIKK